MHRPAVRSALGRGRLHLSRPAHKFQPRPRLFSATQCQRADDSKPPRTSRQRSAAAASELGSLKPAAPKAAVDARLLRASGPGASPSGAKVINFRSLRGLKKTPSGPGPFGFNLGGKPAGDRPGPSGGFRFPRQSADSATANNLKAGFSFAPRGPPRGPRRDGPGGLRTGAGRRPARTGGQKREKRKRFKDDKGKEDSESPAWTASEQAIINNTEQGVVTPYTPEVTLNTLTGYGPAIASKSSQSQVERAIRSMRILGGGRPFNDSIVYDDPRRRLRKYYQEKEPLFFDSMRQKDWLEAQRSGAKMYPAKEVTRKAIVQAAILGKYESRAPQFIEKEDTLGLVASYQRKQISYRGKDAEMFNAKLRALLPMAKPSAPQQKKARA